MGDFYQRQGATARIGEALADRGWDLVAYHPDRSDGQTDYYSPASWDGIARRGGILVMCDVSEYIAERHRKPQPVYGRADGPCSRCDGSGQTSAAAVQYALAAPGPCEACGATGRRVEYGRIVGEEPAIPHVRPCPGRWMAIHESDGRVLGTGQRPLAADQAYKVGAAAAETTVRDIEAAAARAASPQVPDEQPTREAAGATVRPSAVRDGFVEVVHPSKPDQPLIDELRAAGFRWALRARCWYGPRERLPGRYAEAATTG